jgi:ABC-2 type transport system permease protein
MLASRRPPWRVRWEAIRELALCDFRLKYYDSALGYAWSMLSPIAMFAIYYFVFRYALGIGTPGYIVYLMVGVVYWTFFQDCTWSGLTSLAGKAGVLRALPLAPCDVVVASALSTVFTLVIKTVVLVIVLALAGKLSPLAPLVILPLVCLVLLATGLSFLVGLASVQLRDANLIWNLLLQACFWLTPVVYVVDSGLLSDVLYLNPLARCLYLIRWFLVYDYLPSFRFIFFTVVACASAFGLGLWLFLKREHVIPEAL